jgi:hypothetical protein
MADPHGKGTPGGARNEACSDCWADCTTRPAVGGMPADAPVAAAAEGIATAFGCPRAAGACVCLRRLPGSCPIAPWVAVFALTGLGGLGSACTPTRHATTAGS